MASVRVPISQTRQVYITLVNIETKYDKIVYRALIDTGASFSVVSSAVIDRLKPKKSGMRGEYTPKGIRPSIPTYQLSISVLFSDKTTSNKIDANVSQLQTTDPDFDLLLGNDVLQNFIIHIENGFCDIVDQ